jgi:hypothetical protein
VRQVDAKDGGLPIDVIVDFLMPRDAKIEKNKPVLVDNFAVQRADGADLPLRFYRMLAIDGAMPGGGKNRVEIAVASIPALLAMKGFAINGRHKQKDAYDIYYCVRNYLGGPEALAKDCQPILALASGKEGYGHVAEKFAKPAKYFAYDLVPVGVSACHEKKTVAAICALKQERRWARLPARPSRQKEALAASDKEIAAAGKGERSASRHKSHRHCRDRHREASRGRRRAAVRDQAF